MGSFHASVPGFSEYELWDPNMERYSQAYIQKSILDATYTPRNSYDMAIILKSNYCLIGHVHISREHENSKIGCIGYSINSKFQNQGLASEACQALIDFGIQQLKLDTIYATCDTRNIASIRVLEKSGMKRVSHIIGDRKINNGIYDSYRYEITINPIFSK